MMVSEEDRQAVGYTDMREFREFLQNASPILRLLAMTYPPSIYRLRHPDGTVLRAFPQRYYWDEKGNLLIAVIATPELNPHNLYMAPVRITDVDPTKLEPIKWPPDATVH